MRNLRKGDEWDGGFSDLANRAFRYFMYLAGFTLLVTASAKLASGFGQARALASTDPIFGMSLREVLIGAGTVEIIVAVFCIFGKDKLMRAVLIACLGTSFVVYRLGLALIGYSGPCRCMGTITDAIHMPVGMADLIMKCIVGFLLIGGYSTVLVIWMEERSRRVAPTSQRIGR